MDTSLDLSSTKDPSPVLNPETGWSLFLGGQITHLVVVQDRKVEVVSSGSVGFCLKIGPKGEVLGAVLSHGDGSLVEFCLSEESALVVARTHIERMMAEARDLAETPLNWWTVQAVVLDQLRALKKLATTRKG